MQCCACLQAVLQRSERLAEVTAVLEAQRSVSADAQDAAASARQASVEAQAQAATLAQSLATVSAERDDLQDQVSSLSTTLSARDQELGLAREEIVVLTQKAAAVTQALEARGSDPGSPSLALEGQLGDAHAALAVAQLERTVETLQAEVAAAQGQTESSKHLAHVDHAEMTVIALAQPCAHALRVRLSAWAGAVTRP